MKPKFEGKQVVVRSGQAGVFVGKLLHREGDRVWLQNSLRLWLWKVAKSTDLVASCSEIATHGVLKASCRLSCVVPMHEVGQVIEIIPLTKVAAETFK